MAKFCGNCGSQLNDSAAFCINCGAPCAGNPAGQQSVIPESGQNVNNMGGQDFGQPYVQNNVNGGQNGYGQFGYSQPAYNVQPGIGSLQAGKKPLNKSLFIVGGALLLLIIVLVVVICIIAGNGYKKPLNKYVDLIEDGDVKGFVDCIYVEDSSDLYYYLEDATEEYEDKKDEYGSDVKVSYDIISKTEMPESLINIANLALSSDMQIKKAYTLQVKFTYKGSKNVDVDTETIEVVKTKDGWKISDF